MKKNYIGSIELIEPPKEITRESVAIYLSRLSSVVYSKEIGKNPLKRLDSLLIEAYGNTASRVLEFLPCKVSADIFLDKRSTFLVKQFFGFFDKNNDWYFTNAREILNWGFDFEEVLEFIDFTNYKALRCVAPYFIYGQISTHNQLTTVSHSQRYANCDRGYWCPPETLNRINNLWRNKFYPQDFTQIIEDMTPSQLRDLLKNSGIKRKEVYDRGADMLQNRPFSIGGYTNNPNAWKWFLKQRGDSHTQIETKDFVKMLKEVIDES